MTDVTIETIENDRFMISIHTDHGMEWVKGYCEYDQANALWMFEAGHGEAIDLTQGMLSSGLAVSWSFGDLV